MTMAVKAWLATCGADGLPVTIDADARPSIARPLEAVTARYADRPAFRALGRTPTSLPCAGRQKACATVG